MSWQRAKDCSSDAEDQPKVLVARCNYESCGSVAILWLEHGEGAERQGTQCTGVLGEDWR